MAHQFCLLSHWSRFQPALKLNDAQEHFDISIARCSFPHWRSRTSQHGVGDLSLRCEVHSRFWTSARPGLVCDGSFLLGSKSLSEYRRHRPYRCQLSAHRVILVRSSVHEAVSQSMEDESFHIVHQTLMHIVFDDHLPLFFVCCCSFSFRVGHGRDVFILAGDCSWAPHWPGPHVSACRSSSFQPVITSLIALYIVVLWYFTRYPSVRRTYNDVFDAKWAQSAKSNLSTGRVS